MSVVAALQGADGLHVEPGSSATCQLSVANTGTIVEQYTLLFLGGVGGWATAKPEVISLFPGAQQTVDITFRPPRLHTTPGGAVDWAVKVIPSNEPDESVVEESMLDVGTFRDVSADLLPRMVGGRVAARQQVAIDSRGNTPVPVVVKGIDAADAMRFRVRPAELSTVPGAAHFIALGVRPKKHYWRGPPQQKQYQVQVIPEGEKPIVLNGAYSQKPIIPRGAPALAGLLAALLLLWFLVIKPEVRSNAVAANKAALAAEQAQTSALAKQVAAANQAASAAGQQANAASAQANAASKAVNVPVTTPTTLAPVTTTTTTTPPTTVAPVATPVTPTTTPPPVTGPSDGRLSVIAPPGGTATNATTALGAGSTLAVTDIVIQNVSGSTGTARIQRLAPNKAPEDLLVENLADLTDEEFRLDTPMQFTQGQQLELRVDCNGDQTACNVGVYYTGPLTQPASATTTLSSG